jgi:Ser/Thr protein kinase RdoA (MazF antagonist)
MLERLAQISERIELSGEENARRTQEMLERLGQILERMDQRSEERARRMEEMLFEWRRLDEEANKRFERLLSEMQETQRLTNALIKAEGEEVKALIKELLRESKA